MTLKEFALRAERHRERVKREDRRAGEIVAILFNANRDPDKLDAIEWQDVFSEWKEPKESIPEQTEEQMLDTMKLLAASTRGLEP